MRYFNLCDYDACLFRNVKIYFSSHWKLYFLYQRTNQYYLAGILSFTIRSTYYVRWGTVSIIKYTKLNDGIESLFKTEGFLNSLDINVAPRDISNVIVTVKGNHLYIGNQIQPEFKVTDSTIAITKDDYTHQYDTNVDAGTDAGVIILTGQHNYTDTKTVKFDIEPRKREE